MATLLHIDSSPMGEHSVTRHLTAHFAQHWKKANPAGTVIARDVYAQQLPPVSGEWVAASYTPADKRTDAQNALLAESDALIGELKVADEYLFGVPMHNFSVPSTLKLWIDQISRAGVTFAYGANGPEGLLKGKKATVIVAAGGLYGPGAATESLNHVDPYLRSVLGFLGVTDVKVISAGGAAAVRGGGVTREAFLAPHLAEISGHFVTKTP